MKIEKGKHVTDSDDQLLVKFQFSKLFEIPSMNYARIRNAVTKLKRIVNTKKFYDNTDGCVITTLEFVRVYSHMLMENVESSSTLLSLVGLLKDIVAGINSMAFPISSDEIDEILTLLLKILECSLEDNVKLQVGSIVIYLMEVHSIVLCSNADFISLISKVCILLDEGKHMYDLNCISEALLKWRGRLKIDMRPIIESVELQCEEHLNLEIDLPLLQQILKCLLTYYKTREEINFVTNTLKRFLNRLCAFMSISLLRNSTEELLAILIEELYCTQPVVWPGGKDAILKEIQALPNRYQEWPYVDGNIFFVIAYLSFLHSELLWSCSVIRQRLECYVLESTMISQLLLLKALVMLYPIAINNDSVHSHTGRVLLDSLGACKSLPELLTYHPSQMMWLLTNAKTIKMKIVVIISWLRIQNDDAPIISVLDSAKVGFLLVKFFQNYPDVAISSSYMYIAGLLLKRLFPSNVKVENEVNHVSSKLCTPAKLCLELIRSGRVLQLITKLTPEPNLEKSIECALPLVCTRPTVFAQLLQVKPTIPVDLVDRLNLINVISASLPFLTEDVTIQAACYYTIRLLNSVKNQPNGLLMFCQYIISIKFLVAKSAAAEDATAIAAIKLLRRLVNNQVVNNVKVEIATAIQFPAVLQGKLFRISAGLKLLQTVLSCEHRTLLLNIDKVSLFGLYHFMHNLTRQQETAAGAFKVLRQLLLREKNFAFSLATYYALGSICKKDVDSKTVGPFLEFLEKWLTYVVPYPYIEVPVDNLLALFDQLGLNNNVYHSIFQLLAKYKQHQCPL